MSFIKILDDEKLIEYYEFFNNFNLLNAIYYKEDNHLEIHLANEDLLPLAVFNLLHEVFTKQLKIDCKISIEYNNYPLWIVYEYLDEFKEQYNFKNIEITFSNDSFLLSEDDPKISTECHEKLNEFIKKYSLNVQINKIKKLNDNLKIEENEIQKILNDKSLNKKENNTKNKNYVTNKKYNLVKIANINEATKKVTVEADVFATSLEERLAKGNLFRIFRLGLYDQTEAIFADKIVNEAEIELFSTIKKDDKVRINGEVVSFNNEIKIKIESLEKLANDFDYVDDASEKRAELHIHSNKSDLDGILDISDFIKASFKMGHKGMAVVDNLGVQAFPKAQKTLKSLLKENENSDFKVVYGCQFKVASQENFVIDKKVSGDYKDHSYVIFDLETTGLSPYYERVTEFAATIYDPGKQINETYQFFVNPHRKLNSYITEKTHIKQSDVDNALDFKDHLETIKKICENRILVAHNAKFDISFLNAEFKRANEPELTNPVIDTLALSRILKPKLKSHRLGNVAKNYSILYEESKAHRADYDTDILARVFVKMQEDLTIMGINNLDDLFKLNDQIELKSHNYDLSVLALNDQGLKNLFKLVSIAHTKEYSYVSKSDDVNNDLKSGLTKPRLFKSTISENRDNLLIGSALIGGEIFEIAAYGSEQSLKEAISFVDYVEIMPLASYQFLVETNKIESIAILKDILLRIINCAKTLNKLVIATNDAYYLKDEQKIFRDVYINTKGIGGARHPLYIYDDFKRSKIKSPNHRMLNTNEMLEAFSFLEDDALIREIVTQNPNKILDMCSQCYPVHSKLYPPVIKDSDKNLRKIVYEKLTAVYGESPDPLIKERIDKELATIIENGYSVVYYVSHLLIKKSNDDGYLVGSRGSVGSSLVATMAGITEVNPLPPHYICPACKYFVWQNDVLSGYDLKSCNCPKCNHLMKGEGQNIPFETFLGFKGDKIPDIDLNFSGEYQEFAHDFTKEVFDDKHVFRAGTISTVANKTAFAYAREYLASLNHEHKYSKAFIEYLAANCVDVKRSTGQHPGGIVVIPGNMDVNDFTPIQYPANKTDAKWYTTHFDYHDIHDNVLKFDILGHVDPTAMKFLFEITKVDPLTIPLNDEKALSLFYSTEHLNLIDKNYTATNAALGLPEFGTKFVRGVLAETKPRCFSDLIQISGLTHGTNVYSNNAKDLILKENIPLKDVIGCRDDIMTKLISYGLDNIDAFNIMEDVRKGKGLNEKHTKLMIEKGVPKWYLDSCNKIKYMFPKAHAVAYVIMALRVAWYKVYYPLEYYACYLSLRVTKYDFELLLKGKDAIINKYELLKESQIISDEDKDYMDWYEILVEMFARGYTISNIDLKLSDAKNFIINPNNKKELIPPFIVVKNLGEAVANKIISARNEAEFANIEDFKKRSGVTKTHLENFRMMNVFEGLEETNQYTLF